jgi:hypothetical protein
MTELAKPAGAGKWERVRRLRYGHVIKLILARYGTDGVPDDDAGRPDLMELLYLASQAPTRAAMRVANLIELYAPWMQPDESAALIEHLAIIPDYQKARTSEELGQLLHLKNVERERLRLWSIRPFDVTADAFANQSKSRSLQRRAAKRRANGVKPRAEYLAELAAKPKPWIDEGISARQWRRRRSKLTCPLVVSDMSAGQVETIVLKAEPHLRTSKQGETLKGLQGRGRLERRREQAEEKQVESEEQRGLSADRPHPGTSDPHPLEAALQNWGRNAEKKNSTISRDKNHRGWNDLSEFEAFSTEVPWCPLEALPRDLPVEARRAAA